MKSLKTIVILMSAILLAACTIGGGTPAPTQDISQTLDAAKTSAVQTFEAEQQGLATATPLPPTATVADTSTPEPTPTLVPTLAPTNTQPAVVPTNTRAPVSAGGGGPTSTPVLYDCSVTIVAPAFLGEFDPYEDIDAKWTVKNTGSRTWGATDVDYAFISGQDMAKFEEAYNLPKDIAPGQSIDIVVDMLAPALPGTYRTTWGLTYGSGTFCAFSINIVVK